VIAEAGVHHDNDVERAKELIRAAHEAGADAVKFQTYSANRLAAKWAPTYWDDESGRTQHDIFAERSLLTGAEYRELFAFAAELGILLLSTPFDTDAVEMLAGLGMAAFKIASADITDIPLLQACASHGLPVLMSTGASHFDEVQRAVDAVTSAGSPALLLHCSLAYPTPIADANLPRITTLGELFPDVVVGYSDHVQPQDSELPCPIAVTLGASVIEKHFTLDKSLPGDDHYHAVDPEGLARLVKNCADAWAMTRDLGETTEVEMAARSFARRSVVAARTLKAGTVLTAGDVDFKRPGTGLSPADVERVLGHRLSVNLDADALVLPEHVETRD
jgi:N-acetylneuraminate synthase